MPDQPLLSLCVPTFNRAGYLRGTLDSALREMATLPHGQVELLVCDNASTDETPALLATLQAAHPTLRVERNAENLGFDRNYLACVEAAHGEFVWVMGDDDVWMPGSLSRMLREFEAGADVALCLAEACDLDLNPWKVLSWFRGPQPPTRWRIEGRDDLIAYFDACTRNAGAFAFISVAAFRRSRFLANADILQRSLGTGYPHLWGMMAFLLQPTRLHYIPEALVRNRVSDLHADSHASTDLFGRWLVDLRSWAQAADALFADDPGLHEAFSHILGRNHHDTILPGMRMNARTEAEWEMVVPLLERAGFSPVQIAATHFGHRHLKGQRQPQRDLDPGSLCLADLPLLTRGALDIAVLAMGDLQPLIDGSGILAALREHHAPARIRIFCPGEWEPLLDGFEVLPIDSARYASDASYRDGMLAAVEGFSPHLAVNLDPERGIEADDLMISFQPAGAVAFALPERGQAPELVEAVNANYSRLIPRASGFEAMRQALGLDAMPPALWPTATAREDAAQVMTQLGWDPQRTLAILLDQPELALAPNFQTAFAQARQEGWTFLGLGGRGTRATLAALCEPLGARAANLAGVLDLGAMSALLAHCGGFLGGTPLAQSVAKASGCEAYRAAGGA